MEEKLVAKITHYFNNIGVAVVEITEGSLKKGDKIHFKGATTDFEQIVDSIQIEHESVDEVETGKTAGLKVDQAVREGDEVYKVIE